MKRLHFIVASFIIILFFYSSGIAQVTISPTAVFLDSNSKVGSFFVSNPSNSAVEVRLSFEFAYPATDETGRLFLNYDDNEAEERFSLIPHLRAFPTTFILDPNQRQTIRLIGRLPQSADPATYWTRMRVSSSQLTPPIGETAEGQVAAQVTFQIDQVTAVLVHHGSVQTGVTIHSTEARIDADRERLLILTDVERTGNAPFIGSVTTSILGPNGQEVDTRRSSTSVYFRNLQRVEFELSDLPSGNYTAVTTYETSRNDISSRNLVQAVSTTERLTFSIE
jgi:P pilus assembly chaperone PapD